MIKKKLQEKRLFKKISQEDMAFKLGIETSGYNRRENGITKISKSEWLKLTKILECSLEDIYEPDDGIYVINGDNTQGNFGNNGTFNQTSEYFLELQRKYILKLEEENTTLKTENTSLKEEIAFLREQVGGK
jgi:transcriptional regulator with XRE-family HTH domain